MAQYYTAGQALPPVGSAAYVSAQQGSGQAPVYNPQNTAQSQPAVSPMSANTFTQNTPAVQIPPQPTYSNPGVINTAGLANATLGMTVGSDGKITYKPPEVATTDNSEQQGRASNLMTVLGLAPKKENILSSPEVVNQQNVVQQQRATLNDYTSQLNNVIAKQNQDLLSTRASVSAEGGTEAVYGGIAATINREAAIRALPLQAAVAAAQGNVQLAQEYLTQVTALKTEQVANDYAYKTLQYQAISNFVTNEQNIRLDELKTKAANEFELKKLDIQNEYAVSLQKLKDQATGGSTPTIKSINGVDMQWNPTTSQWETPVMTGGTGGTNELKLAQAKSNVDQISGLTSGIASTAVGPNALGRSQPGFWRNVGKALTGVGIPQQLLALKQNATGERQNFIAGVEQLRSTLNLDTLISAKKQGATFGALSNQELQVLASAATKIGTWAIKDKDGNVTGYNITEKEFKAELDKINNFAKLDYILKGGNTADVGVNILEDGTYWAQNSDGSFTQIR